MFELPFFPSYILYIVLYYIITFLILCLTAYLFYGKIKQNTPNNFDKTQAIVKSIVLSLLTWVLFALLYNSLFLVGISLLHFTVFNIFSLGIYVGIYKFLIK